MSNLLSLIRKVQDLFFSGYSPDRVQEIVNVCNEIGVKCIRFYLDYQYRFIDGYKQFESDSFTGDGSRVCGYAFT